MVRDARRSAPALIVLLLLGWDARAEDPGAPALPAGAVMPEATVPEGNAGPSPEPERFVARFDEALQLRTDVLLEGANAAAEVVFPIPSEWTLREDPVLELSYDYSPALNVDRSHLTLALNEQPIATVALDPEARPGVPLAISLPREALQPWNRLSVRAVQHLGTACEDPFDPSLWTRIRRSSSVRFVYDRASLVDPDRPLDLANFPAPFLDETGYGPAAFSLVLGAAPTKDTVAAVGRLAVTLGRLAAYRRVTVAPPVQDLAAARTHAIAIGLPGENPVIRALLGPLTLAPAEGLVALRPNPHDPRLGVLVVTGADPSGLARAINALAGRNRRELLTGQTARIRVATDATPPASRQLPRPAPATADFSLADLGMDDQTVQGFYTPSVQVPLGLEGDAVVRPEGAFIDVAYGFAAGLDARQSAMEVRIDGITLGNVPLDAQRGATRTTTRVQIPGELVSPDSVVEVRFHLLPSDFDVCRYTGDRALWATVYASTELHLPRDRFAKLPDLSRLRFGSWPFTLEPGRGAVVLALPDAPSPEEVSAGVAVAAELARSGGAEAPALRMAVASEVPLTGSTEASFVLLTGGSAHGGFDALERMSRLHVAPVQGGLALLNGGGPPLVAVASGQKWASIEQILHPSNPDRAVLAVRASDTTMLPVVVRALTDPHKVRELGGSAAILSADGQIRTLALTPTRQVGAPALGALLVGGVRRHWILLGIALVGSALFLSALRKAWARTRSGA